MSLIYEPKGRAREYSPLALNIYTGCDHGCKYCYGKLMWQGKNWTTPRLRDLKGLEREVERLDKDKQVLLCFMGDPYCHLESENMQTRKVLELFLDYQVPTAILTKGGKRCLRDLDLFLDFEAVKVGASLTLIEEKDSLDWESNAALPGDRIETLRILHEQGIMTWVSLEPVIDPEQTLDLIDRTHEFVDHYKVGKMNHHKLDINWKDFGLQAIERLDKYGKDFYIKEDLAKYIPAGLMTEEQRDMDYLNVKAQRDDSAQLALF